MLEPYRLTREERYLGLPLGFGFLGKSFAFSALTYSPLTQGLNPKLMWFGLLTRTFAFVFIAANYFFPNIKSRKSHLLGAVLRSEANSEKVVLTHIQNRINVPFDRLKNYIIELMNLGFN